MKFVFYTNSLSPHQFPLAREMVRLLGNNEYRYVYTRPLTDERRGLGWGVLDAEWIVCEKDCKQKCRAWLETCDVLMCSLRDFDLFSTRIATGRKTIYTSERWFKPISFTVLSFRIHIPGWIRLVSPRYLTFAWKMSRLIGGDNTFVYYPLGIWARRDIELVLRLFGVSREKYLPKIRLWGYCVAPSECAKTTKPSMSSRRVLWVGRMLDWKRVDTIIRAVASIPTATFDVYGAGPMETAWRKLAMKIGNGRIVFHGPVSIQEVRSLMRTHDVYVLASDAGEGWGAALNEAMEEGMRVLGTYEAGASATILPNLNLYHAGDWKELAKLLTQDIPTVTLERWVPQRAAEELLKGVV